MLNITKLHENANILKALDRSQAVIEFKPDGTILTANKNFLDVLGYSLDEIKGKHHSMFVEKDYTKNVEYQEFWDRLRAGEFFVSQYKRIRKDGQPVWIDASYNPVLGKNGKPYKIIKFATDITDKTLTEAEKTGLVDALNRSQAVIHFTMDGTILDANENFLKVMGYTLGEIKGKHHSMFADPAFAASQEYKDFWHKLNAGEFQSAQYLRLGKGGKEVWIEASYNPIFGPDGKPFKVVKFATDLTPRKEENKRLANDFETNVGELVQNVAAAAVQMRSTSQMLAAAAEETSTQSNTVAAATEELSVSVNEIAGQVSNSTKVVQEAVEEAEKSENLVADLVEAAGKISEVTALISEIAEQTNLLALNATIEAARAGDAGKGFAVVASEVKKLAQETAQATENISSQIANIQDVSRITADAIKNITQVIGRVSNISTAISSAVEQQSAATQEVAANITGVQTAANDTGTSASTVSDVSQNLSSQSEELQVRVSEFLTQVRTM